MISIDYKQSPQSLEKVLERVNAIQKIADKLHTGLYLGDHFVEGGSSQIKYLQTQFQKELTALFSDYPDITKELGNKGVNTENIDALQCDVDQVKMVADQLIDIEKIIKNSLEKSNNSTLPSDNMVKKFEYAQADYLPLAEEIIAMVKGKDSSDEIQKNIVFLQKISSLTEEKKIKATFGSRDALELNIIKKVVVDRILSILLPVDVNPDTVDKKIKNIHGVFTQSKNLIDLKYSFELNGAYENNNQEKIPTRKEPEASIIGEVLKYMANGAISLPAEADKYYFQKKGTYTPGMRTKLMEKLFHDDERLRFFAGYIKSASLGVNIPVIGKHEALIDLDTLERVFQKIWADGYIKEQNLSHIQHFKNLSRQKTIDVSEEQDTEAIEKIDPQQTECRIQKAIQREIGMEGVLLTEYDYQKKILNITPVKMEIREMNKMMILVKKAMKYQHNGHLEMWRYKGLVSLQQKLILELGLRDGRKKIIEKKNMQMMTLKKFIGKGMKILKIDDLSEYIENCKEVAKNMNITTSNVDAKKIRNILEEIDFLICLPSGEFDVRTYKNKDTFGYDYADLINQLKNIFQDKKRTFEGFVVKEVHADIPKKKKKYEKDFSLIQPSIISPKNKTFDDCLKEADQDFAAGGPKLLVRAKEKYTYILNNFIGRAETKYILDQIKLIDQQIDFILNIPPKQTSSSSDSSTGIFFPPLEKIDPKTGTIKNDFYKPEK